MTYARRCLCWRTTTLTPFFQDIDLVGSTYSTGNVSTRRRIALTSVVDPGCLSRIRLFFIPESGSEIFPSRIRIKAKKMFLSSKKYDPVCSSRIRILTFYPSRIPDPGVKKAPDPDPQHWLLLPCSRTLTGWTTYGRRCLCWRRTAPRWSGRVPSSSPCGSRTFWSCAGRASARSCSAARRKSHGVSSLKGQSHENWFL